MPVPPECQPIADEIANLSNQERAVRDAIANLEGTDRWKKMLDLGKLRQQLTEQQDHSQQAYGGTASAAFPPPLSSPFTFKNTLHIAPAFSMTPSAIVDVLTGTAPTLSTPGLIGNIIQTSTPMLSRSLVAQNVTPMLSLLNTLIANQVVDTLGLSTLPSGCILSIRSLTFDEENITCTPVIGAFGTVLSTFVPAAPGVSVSMQSLSVQPSLIASSAPADAEISRPALAVVIRMRARNTCRGSVSHKRSFSFVAFDATILNTGCWGGGALSLNGFVQARKPS